MHSPARGLCELQEQIWARRGEWFGGTSVDHGRLPSFTTNFRALSFQQVIRKSMHTTDHLHPGGVLPSEQRLRIFLLGRLAIRQALPSVAELSLTSPISKDEHGRPQVPPGFLGSISHKDKTGVALVVPQHQEDSIMKKKTEI